jgi:uncharacterized protein
LPFKGGIDLTRGGPHSQNEWLGCGHMQHQPNDLDSKEKTSQTAREQDASGQGWWITCRRLIYDSFLEPLIKSRHPPWFDARGVCIGLVVGFAVPVGGHTIAVALLRMLFKFNLVVAIAFTWVCNPFNMFFLYYGYYLLGSAVLGKSASMDFDLFRTLLHPVAAQAHFWETLSEFMKLGGEMLGRWCVGGVILAAVFGVVGYVVTHRIQRMRCRAAAQKMRVRYEHYLAELEKKT